ncbi:MAG: type II toxin-antitoxin system HicA family toxin [Chloroflexi bacterium]|nr:MAG: type II toxin-antitoxin system HicA family toxin [Chloroflexota bacterium]
MPRMPRVTGAEVLRALRSLVWVVAAQPGSHIQLKHPDRPGRLTIPIHAGETIGPRLLGSILTQAGLSVDEFRSAL